jgi:hypothetical protein
MTSDQLISKPDSSVSRPRDIGWLLLVIALVAAFVAYFARFYSFLPDDGSYAWVAKQLLDGKVLHRDVQDVHAGYINFANAAALRLFGESLLSMRVPLVIFTVLEAALMFWIARRTSLGIALGIAAVFATLTFVQFINPSANWYSLFGAVLTITWLSLTDPDTRMRVFVTGLLLGAVLMIRQLSGVILAVGVLAFLLYEHCHDNDQSQRGLFGPSVLVTLSLLLGIYAWRHSNATTFLLFALWPLLLALIIARQARISNADALQLFGGLVAGAAIPVLPLIGYHVAHDSVGPWLNDMVFVALSLADSEFTQELSYSLYLIVSIYNISSMQPAQVINGLYWIALTVAPTMLGLRLITATWRRRPVQFPALVVVASFFALVSLHYQTLTYLYFSSALTLSAVAIVVGSGRQASPRFAAAVLFFLASVGAWYHAAQEPIRTVGAILNGERLSYGEPCHIPRLQIRIAPQSCAKYNRLLELIDQQASSGQAILAIPVNPELYFLSGRPAAVPFFNTALGLAGEGAVEKLVHDLSSAPPALVFFHPDDKYNTSQSERLMDWVRAYYRLITTVGDTEVYQPR